MYQNPQIKYAGIILAAGLSSRMNSWKPGFIINGIPLAIHAVAVLLPYCRHIVVVGGYNFNQLKKIIKAHAGTLNSGENQVILVENTCYANGMFSSVQRAVSCISDEYSGVFLLPGDMPFVRKSTAELLRMEYEAGGAEVIIPAVRLPEENILRKGHPVLFGREVCSAILHSENDNSLRDIISRFSQKIIETNDQGICFDIDCQTDLQHINKFIDY